MSALPLVVVGGTDVEAPAKREPSPETQLRRLFRQEAAAELRLLEVRGELTAARCRYARKHRLAMLPSLDTLRRLFGRRA